MEKAPDLKELLKNKLTRARRIAVLGIGSEFRGDDAAGSLIAEKLSKKKLSRKNITVGVFNGATAPENLTGEIKRFKPTHLIIIDAVDFKHKAGSIIVMDPQAIDGATFSTHTLPAKILSDYLSDATKCTTTIIGIQAKSLLFGSSMSKSVASSVTYVTKALADSIARA